MSDDEFEVVWRGDWWRTFTGAPPVPEPARAPRAPRQAREQFRPAVWAALTLEWDSAYTLARRARVSPNCVRRWLRVLVAEGLVEARTVRPLRHRGRHVAEYRRA